MEVKIEQSVPRVEVGVRGRLIQSPIINRRLANKMMDFRKRDRTAECFRKHCLSGKAVIFFIA